LLSTASIHGESDLVCCLTACFNGGTYASEAKDATIQRQDTAKEPTAGRCCG